MSIPMPELGLPRLLIVNRTVEYRDTLSIGSQIRRVSSLKELKEKSSPSGPMAVVTFSHELFVDEQTMPALIETQTYVLLGQPGRTKAIISNPIPTGAMQMKTVIPDETLLFQYSALGFNSHKIHIDKAYAREVEGFPDLVVNGGLTTLLMTEFARLELGLTVTLLRMKNVAPLFCGRPITLTADCFENQWCLKAFNDTGILAAEMELVVL
jgi:3-methylfumaryl-CoA hydratase